MRHLHHPEQLLQGHVILRDGDISITPRFAQAKEQRTCPSVGSASPTHSCVMLSALAMAVAMPSVLLSAGRQRADPSLVALIPHDGSRTVSADDVHTGLTDFDRTDASVPITPAAQ